MSFASSPFAPKRSSTIAIRAASAIGVTAIVAVVGYFIATDRQGKTEAAPLPPRMPGGALLVCGGGEISDDIYRRFAHIAGAAQGRLVVIPSYVPNADDEARLIDRWTKRGFHAVEVLHAASRAEADDPAFAEPLNGASAVWLSGGDQARLGDLYADTEVERRLRALFDRGGIIGASGGGAAALTRVMIASNALEQIDSKALAGRGLDLLAGAVVDQNLLRANRLNRLLSVLRDHPDLIGLGVDSDTAVLVERGGAEWSVLGKGYAVVCLPDKAGTPRLEILKPGDSTQIADLKQRPGIEAITSQADFDRWLSNPDFYDRAK